MSKAKLVYIMSLRNAAADKAGQYIDYKGGQRYMKSPLEYLAEALERTPLGDAYSLEAVLFDDDEGSPRDRQALQDYGFGFDPARQWIYPGDLQVQGRRANDIFHNVPSTYRRLPLDAAAERAAGKKEFEQRLLEQLTALEADLVVLDGLLVILDQLARPESPFFRRIVNIHPGITRLERRLLPRDPRLHEHEVSPKRRRPADREPDRRPRRRRWSRAGLTGRVWLVHSGVWI